PTRAVGAAARLALVAGGLFLHGLGRYALLDPDEARHAEVAREMAAASGVRRLFLPTLDFEPYREKPPGYYWLVALAYGALGVGEAGARGGSALAAPGAVRALYAYALARVGGPAGAGAGAGAAAAGGGSRARPRPARGRGARGAPLGAGGPARPELPLRLRRHERAAPGVRKPARRAHLLLPPLGARAALPMDALRARPAPARGLRSAPARARPVGGARAHGAAAR